ncbi:hypothetical protein [Radiobacillus sp. PE A8.2]|uniref:hypothetical protein n=1 Tax=Radiobacillus sp. PE A8.2 TaxID=3380349 RepID=UPI0038900915
MDLPSILAGPIVRRVTPSQACIWIATSENFQLDALLYEIITDPDQRTDYTPVAIHTESETVSFGKKLYIHLIHVTPTSTYLPTNTLLGYNLLFRQEANVLDLQSFGLLSPQNPHAIVYDNLKYPTFFINTLENTNLIYSSCRKLHGKGEDALASADLILRDNARNLGKRPSSLFFMGDQIYADDAPDPVIRFLSALGDELIGSEEPLHEVDDRLQLSTFQEALQKIHGRQYIMEQLAAFTSTHAHNHVITFGEYAALYVLSWSPELWELAEAYGVFDIQPNMEGDYYFVYSKGDKEYTKEKQQHIDRYQEQLEELYSFKQTVSYIRRLMANTPTYMIFDDHDITDDWNLTQNWKTRVNQSNLGRHVIANGLTAYWAFQGWGNNPNAFPSSFKQAIVEYFQSLCPKSSFYQRWLDLLWDYENWHFVAPTVPKAVFIDTRTMRTYDPLPRPTSIGSIIEENPKSAQLISKHGWKQISDKLLASGWEKGNKLLIVSATPLYGIGLIESFLDKLIYPLRSFGLPIEQMIDFEAWKYNGEGFNLFIQQIAEWQPSSCLILSGDVHYAASVKSHIQFSNSTEMNLYQFTSSPTNNQSFYGLWGAVMKRIIANNAKRRKKPIYRFCDDDYHLCIEDYCTSCPASYKWKETIRYLAADDSAIIHIDNNVGLLSLTPDSARNSLLQYYGLYSNEKHYTRIDL